MPIAVPGSGTVGPVTPPVVPVGPNLQHPNLTQWVQAVVTTSAGFNYDVSDFVQSFDLTGGRTSATEATVAAGTCSVVFDDTAGTFDPDNTASPLYNVLTLGPQSTTTFRLLAGIPSLNGYETLFTGPFDSLERTFTGGDYSETTATFVDPTAELTRHIPAAGLVLPEELPGARIARLLTTPSRSGFMWTTRCTGSPLALDTGQKMLSAFTCDGTTSSWDIAVQAAAAEGGLLFFGRDGSLIFQGQAHRLSQSLRWVLSDAAAQTHYESDVTFRLSTDDLIVDAAVTTSDGVTSICGPGGLSQTTSTNFQADITETSQLAGNISGASRARYLYRSRSVPRRNAPTVTLNMATTANVWTYPDGHFTEFQAGSAGAIGDGVSIVRTPSKGTQISEFHWLEGWSMSAVCGESWTSSWNVSRADPLPPNGYWTAGVSRAGFSTVAAW